ncbi:hypothetical protein DITRI_Ditri13aG0047700 [Diplodiscus trichospermus]
MPEGMGVLISQATKNKMRYHTLRFLEELMGKIPILHIEDACNAHIFCLEKPSMSGRFLCASAYLSSAETASYYRKNYPDIEIPDDNQNRVPSGFQVCGKDGERNSLGFN